MAFQVERARDFYAKALALLPSRDRRAQRPGLMMAAVYRALLTEIERDGYRVLDRRISLAPAVQGVDRMADVVGLLNVLNARLRACRDEQAHRGHRRRLRRIRSSGHARSSGARSHGVRDRAHAGRPRATRRRVRCARRQRRAYPARRVSSAARAAAHRPRRWCRARTVRSATTDARAAWRVPAAYADAAGTVASCGGAVHDARGFASGLHEDGDVRSAARARGFSLLAAADRGCHARGPASGRDSFSLGAAVPRRAEHADRERIGAGFPQRAARRLRGARARFRHAAAARRPHYAVSRCRQLRSSPIAAAKSGVAPRSRASLAVDNAVEIACGYTASASMQRSSQSARTSSLRCSKPTASRVAALLAQVAAFSFEPITTAYLQYAASAGAGAADDQARRRARTVAVRSRAARRRRGARGGGDQHRGQRRARSRTMRSRAQSTMQLRRRGAAPSVADMDTGDRGASRHLRMHARVGAAQRRIVTAASVSRRRLYRSGAACHARSGDPQRCRRGARAARSASLNRAYAGSSPGCLLAPGPSARCISTTSSQRSNFQPTSRSVPTMHEAGGRVHADRRGVAGVADHRDHLSRPPALAPGQQLMKQ